MNERIGLKIFTFKFDSSGGLFFCVCFKSDFERLGPQVVNDFAAFKGVENNLSDASESFMFSLQCSNRHKDYLSVKQYFSSNELSCAYADCGVVPFPNQIAS